MFSSGFLQVGLSRDLRTLPFRSLGFQKFVKLVFAVRSFATTNEHWYAKARAQTFSRFFHLFKLDRARVSFSPTERHVQHAFVFEIHGVRFSANPKRSVHPFTCRASRCLCNSTCTTPDTPLGDNKLRTGIFTIGCSLLAGRHTPSDAASRPKYLLLRCVEGAHVLDFVDPTAIPC